ncbi:ATP-binding protein [Actinocatenispora rupis]|uniref:histidine kinase n=1 Tax=Actinocatenispora rupis TaxID=519421 RepID=A0A8J3IXN6_9ACTN|nr:ATP-binding protein [Actinocatenispora rupis]GID10620.1 histidine kinase [Actinocatenispora rupis]
MSVSTDGLRELFLFEHLDDEQLAWVGKHADEVRVPAGTTIVTEGEEARCFYVLRSGTITMHRAVTGGDMEINRSDQVGAYFGAVTFYLGDQIDQKYKASVRAVTDTVVLALPADEFGTAFSRWYPMAVHLLQGMLTGSRNTDALVSQRERLLALGKLTAGLTHELNNPAAAAVRATGALRERVAGMRHKLAMLAAGDPKVLQLKHLTDVQEEYVARVAKAPTLTALETSDREDAVADWLDDHGVANGWDIAPVLVGGGITVDDLDLFAANTRDEFLEPALRWLGYTVETETLMNEIQQAVERISALVGSAKQYSQLDRAPHQFVDLHEGLDSTLVMLTAKLGGVHVVKQYDRTLPPVPAYPAELNQVWTNIIDNAVDAMGGDGTLTVRTARDDNQAVVEIADTGSGIPAENQDRIFEPFFTTKPIGHGTGLGLDVSWRIIVKRHGGDLRVTSVPGDTRFTVSLPLTDRA